MAQAQKTVVGGNASPKTPKKAPSIAIRTPPSRRATVDQQQMDMSGLNLKDKAPEAEVIDEPPKITVSREKILEEAKHVLDAENQNGKKGISIVVIGKSGFLKVDERADLECP